jgi:hypothetical protein
MSYRMDMTSLLWELVDAFPDHIAVDATTRIANSGDPASPMH